MEMVLPHKNMYFEVNMKEIGRLFLSGAVLFFSKGLFYYTPEAIGLAGGKRESR